MNRQLFPRFFIRAFLLVMATLLAAGPVAGAETNQVAANASAPSAANASTSTNFLQQYHEELLSALRAAEKARVEAEASAKHSAEVMAARLNFIEQSVRARSEHELETIKTWNQFMLTIVSVLGGIGVLGILFVAIFLSRALGRVADTATVGRPRPALEAGHSLPMLGAGELHPGERASIAEQSSARVLGAIERLQRQVDDLERLAKAAPAANDHPQTGEPKETIAANGGEPDKSESPKPTRASKTEKAGLLLGKGQALIYLNQAETALVCFNEALALDPNNLDALVKRGTALERLGRMDEAIESYDRAIALDQSLTTAYLRKGGVFNRLGRHNEALECYEHALRTQEKAGGVA
jgi:tetratricopeptide (TPR) repeat protein